MAAGTDNQDLPQVMGDGLGGSIVLWQDDASTDQWLYAQRLDRWGQALWSAGGVPLTSFDTYQSYPSLAMTEAGRAVCAWRDGRGSDLDVYAQGLAQRAASQDAMPLLLVW